MGNTKKSLSVLTRALIAVIVFALPSILALVLILLTVNDSDLGILTFVLTLSRTWYTLLSASIVSAAMGLFLFRRAHGGNSVFVPVSILGIGLAASLSSWLLLQVEEQMDVSELVDARVRGVALTVEQDFRERASMLKRMAARWADVGGTPKEEWLADARRYVEDKPGYQAIEWIDSDFKMQWIEPLEGNESAIGLDLCFEERRCETLRVAKERGFTSVSQSIDLVQGGKGFLLYEPINSVEKFDGFITGVFRIDPLISRLLEEFPSGIALQLLETTDSGEVSLFSFGPDTNLVPHLSANTTVALANNHWRLEARPSRGFVIAQSSLLPHAFVIICVLLTLFLSVSVYFGHLALDRANLLSQREHDQRRLLDKVPALIASFDRELRVRVVNRVFAEHFQRDRKSLIGLRIDDLFAPQTMATMQPHLDSTLNGAETRFESQIPTGESSMRWLSMHFVPEFDDHGRCNGFYALIQDIHEEKLAKEALSKSEQTLQYASEGSSDGLWDWPDITQDDVWWSPRFYELLGYAPGDTRSGVTSYFSMVHPEDLAKAQEKSNATEISDGETLDNEVRLCTRSGEYRWFRSRSKLFVDPDTGLRRMSGSIQDIHEERLAKDALAAMEERFRIAIEGSSDGLWDWFDISQEQEWWSPSFYELLGYDPEEMASTVANFSSILHPEDHDHTFAAIDSQLAQGIPFDVEYRLRRKDGKYHWFRARAKVHVNEQTGVTRMAGSLQDIQDRKNAEAALAESEQRWRLAAAGTSDGMWDWDVRTGKIWFGDVWKAQLGYQDEEFSNNFQAFEEHVHPDDLPRVHEAIEDHFAHRADYDIEFRMRRKDGNFRWHRARGQALFDENGQAYRMAGSNQDIHQQRVAEELAQRYLSDLSTAINDLQARNQELDEFTYIASHDLQEPLRKLTNFSELLLEDIPDEALNDDARFDLETIQSAARRMRTLVQDLLELSRSGRRDMEMDSFPLDHCVERALEALSLRIEETGAKVQYDKKLPDVTADRSLLSQVFQNLIGNAIKFSPSPSPQIEVYVEPDEDSVIVAIADHGIGIKPEHREQIFAPFKRLHGRDRYEGSGIGLTICRKIVERHRGKIWIEDTPGGGTTFKFTVPKSNVPAMEYVI